MKPKRHIIPVFVPHLGCPNDCVFCNQRKISGKREPADGETVKKAIESVIKWLPADASAELAFYGGSFTAIPAEEQIALLEAALPFLRSGAISEIRVSTRPDAVDEQRLKRLCDYGVKTVELGAQSMDDEVLKASGRGHCSADTERAAKLIKKLGLGLILQMMTGLPGDTDEKSIFTAKKLISLSPDGVRIYPTVIIRDTALYELWEKGEYGEHSVEAAVDLGARLITLFEEADIPVIRFGLNPTDELSGGEAAGGAYHPALGELARSRAYLNCARELLSSARHDRDLVLGVGRGCVSLMTGQKRSNIYALINEYGLNTVKIVETEVPSGKKVAILH